LVSSKKVPCKDEGLSGTVTFPGDIVDAAGRERRYCRAYASNGYIRRHGYSCNTNPQPQFMSFFSRGRKFHFPLWRRYYHTILGETRGHRVWIENAANAVDVSYTHNQNIIKENRRAKQSDTVPLFALDSETLDDPGSAELQ
jgi:hypothetical protein